MSNTHNPEDRDSKIKHNHHECAEGCTHDHAHQDCNKSQEHSEHSHTEETFKFLIEECEKKLKQEEEKRKRELSQMQYCFKEDIKKMHEEYHKKTLSTLKIVIKNIVDPIERAQLHMNSEDHGHSTSQSNVAKGLKLIYDTVIKALKLLHLHRIDTAGIPMDDYIHEATEAVDTDQPELHHHISAIVAPGYYYQDISKDQEKHVLQPAMVKVYEYQESSQSA